MNSILLFKNTNKQKETDPAKTGTAEINGIKYRAACWTNTAKSGQVYEKIILSEIPTTQEDRESYEKTEITANSNDLPF